MFIDTRPGRPDKENEDYAAASSNGPLMCAVVLDGAGGPRELPTGCRHGTPWYVRRLGGLALLNAGEVSTSLPMALASAIDSVADLHPTCDLDAPGTPSSTVTMIRRTPETVECLALGDSTVLVEVDGEIQVITDKRIETVGVYLYRQMALLPTGTPEHQAARIAFVENQRRMRNRPDGYPIASSDPKAAYEAIVTSFPAPRVGRVALMSDGATRFVEFGLGTWRDALDVLGSPMPSSLFDTVRAAEASDPDGKRWPRAKRTDDIAVAYMGVPDMDP